MTFFLHINEHHCIYARISFHLWSLAKQNVCRFHYIYHIVTIFGSGVEQSSCCRKVAGLIPWSACRSVFGQDTEPQTASDVLSGTLHGRHQ